MVNVVSQWCLASQIGWSSIVHTISDERLFIVLSQIVIRMKIHTFEIVRTVFRCEYIFNYTSSDCGSYCVRLVSDYAIFYGVTSIVYELVHNQ